MVAESCESIIINKHTPTNTSLSITVHRITGSNEATTLLHRPGVGIFYNDVRLITNYWAGCITLNHRVTLSPGFSSNKPIHITFGNSDGRQQTILVVKLLITPQVLYFKSNLIIIIIIIIIIIQNIQEKAIS